MIPELRLTDAAEEILAGLWPEQEAPDATCKPTGDAPQEAVRELQAAGLVVAEDGTMTLTEAGSAAAASVVRRERLAERLLADVLYVTGPLAVETACQFEHLLRRGIDDAICTLLGHPRVCPHGSPIPPGPCCKAHTDSATKVVSALADLAPGEGGVIAYLHSQRREIMQRLLTLGAVPGARIVLRQRFPSLVFELGGTEVAVDEATARDIYVRIVHASRPAPRWRNPFRRRRRGER